VGCVRVAVGGGGDRGNRVRRGIGGRWLTLPLLVWFLYLTALAVHTVFEVSPFVALALAMLPDAVLLFLLIVLLVAASL